MSEIKITAKSIARLAYGYELMFRAISEIAGTSGGSTNWFTHKGQEITARVDPLWKLTEESNPHKPGDWCSQQEPFAKWAEDAEAALADKDAEIEKLREAVLEVVSAVRDHLPPDGIDCKAFASRVIGAVDNPTINPIIKAAERINGDA